MSNEPAFLDPSGAVVVDAFVVETAVPRSGIPAGTGSFEADPIAGSLVVLGEVGDLRAARCKEDRNGSRLDCEGWFSPVGGAWSCGEADAPTGEVLVEYQVTCRSDRPTLTTVFSVDERVAALRADLSNGTSMVGIDPESRGLVGLSSLRGVTAVYAQTSDGLVYEVASLRPGLLCANATVASA